MILLVCLVIGLTEISLADRSREHRRRPTAAGSSGSTNSSCPPRRRPCSKDCGTRGFMRNENGCEICACQPVMGCPAIECPDERGVCPFGPLEDENGCRLCECKASPRCSGDRAMCMMFCELGFKNGPDGCPTCECFDPATATQLPASVATTSTRRENRNHVAHRQNRNHTTSRHAQRHQGANRGDPAAAQLPAAFSVEAADAEPSAVACPPICMMFCATGMKTDANGCAICECNDGNNGTRSGSSRRGGGRRSSRRGTQCFAPTCAMYCPNGNRRDENGCTLCECHQPGDAPLQLPTSPSLQCPELRCHRTKKCSFGFAVDSSSGCPSCACRTNAY